MAIEATATPALTMTYTLTNTQGIASTTETATVGYSALQFPNGSGSGNINIGAIITGSITSGENVYFDFQNLQKQVWESSIGLDFTSRDALPIRPHVYPNRGVKGLVLTNTWDGNVFNSGVDYLDTWSGIVTPSGTGLSTLFNTEDATIKNEFPLLNLHATGSPWEVNGPFTDIFNGESGNITLSPKGTWAYSDTIGVTPTYDTASAQYRHVLTLNTENWPNISGSGGLTSGTSGDPVFYHIWNDHTDHGNDANGDPAINPWSGNLPTLSYEFLVIGVTGVNY